MDSLTLVDIELNVDRGYQAGILRSASKEVFGLYLGGTPTQMSYYVDDLLKENDTVFDRARGSMKFYFDAGGNGDPIYCSIDELRRVMFELGLIPDENDRYNLAGFMREIRSHTRKFEEYIKHAMDSGDEDLDEPLHLGDWWEAFSEYESWDE